MTRPGSRLTQLDRTLWVDVDEIVAVQTSIGQLQERRVTITLGNGIGHTIVVGAMPGTGNPRTDEEKDEELAAWLFANLGLGDPDGARAIAQLAEDLGVDPPKGTS